MALALEWSKGGEFRESVPRPWIINGEKAGVTRSGGGLTFATVSGAGHLVSLIFCMSGSSKLILVARRFRMTNQRRRLFCRNASSIKKIFEEQWGESRKMTI